MGEIRLAPSLPQDEGLCRKGTPSRKPLPRPWSSGWGSSRITRPDEYARSHFVARRRLEHRRLLGSRRRRTPATDCEQGRLRSPWRANARAKGGWPSGTGSARCRYSRSSSSSSRARNLLWSRGALRRCTSRGSPRIPLALLGGALCTCGHAQEYHGVRVLEWAAIPAAQRLDQGNLDPSIVARYPLQTCD